MGVSRYATIIVGLKRDQFEIDDEDELEDLLESLNQVSWWYDCDQEEVIYGVEVFSTDSSIILDTDEWLCKISKASHKFTMLTGLVGDLYLSRKEY